MLTVRFFTTASGAEPVAKYLRGLEVKDRARVADVLADIEANGLSAATANLRQLDGKLWELKVAAQRVLYVVIDGPTMILLHAFKKEGQKTPKNEIEIAIKRMRDLLGR